MDYSALINTVLNNANSNTNTTDNSTSKSNGGGSDSYAQISQAVDSIGGSLQNILTAKSQAEAKIAEIKASQKAASTAQVQQYYQNQLDQMTLLLTVLAEKQKKATKSSNTGLYIALGVGGVAILGLIAVIALKK